MLARRRGDLAGNVKFIFQPAEEMAAGAPAMIEDGVLDDPPVDAIFAFHLWNFLPAGAVGLRAGPIWASVDRLRIKIVGRGGHAATPHQTIDPIPTASQVVLALQTLVSRESRLGSPVVLSITSLQAGTTWNVIPGEAVLQGTLRTFDHAQRDALVERAEDVVRGVCLAARADYEFTSEYLAPPVVNDETMTELVRGVAARELGPESIASVEQAALGDDMAFFLDRVPGCYVMMGSRNEARGLTQGHHNAAFDFDESVLPKAAHLLAATALDYLGGA